METYKLPFVRPAEPCYLKNNRSAEGHHCEFVEEAILNLPIVLIHRRAYRAGVANDLFI